MEVKRTISERAKKDLILVSRAQDSQDEKAYSELMRRYRKSVYHVVLKMIKHRDDAEDLTIEAFAKAFKNLHKFNPEYTFSTWLFRIATNNCIDFIRKKKLETTSIATQDSEDPTKTVYIDLRDSSMNPQEIAIQKQKIELMRGFVNKLPEKYRILVELRYFRELSYVEISEELETPLGTIKAQLHRARELLLSLIKDKRESI